MQENNPVPTPVVSPPVVIEQSKQSNFLVILLSSLLIISVAIAGFFAYQTQRLVAELRVKNEELIVKTPAPTVEPVATEKSDVDPTANWKTYTNTAYKYSISYPSTYVVSNQADGAIGVVPPNANNIFVSESLSSKYENRLIDINNIGMLIDISPVDQWQKTSVLVSGVKATKFTKIDKSSNFDIYHVQTNGSGGLEIYVNNKDSKSSDLFNSLKLTN
ncbi:MAG: hypothetical protein ACD_19C00429G0085 [uncultured bacterium]|nr:MAG: hypothetical protein ACD_19C00429G0085 [uncultured bacterium]